MIASMKAVLSALLVLASLSAAPTLPAFAAEPHAPHAMRAITRALDLTPQQQQQAAPIVHDAMVQLGTLHRQASDAALNALSADHRTQVEQIAARTRDQLRALRPSQPPAPEQRASMRQQIAPIVQRGARQIDALLTPQESQAVLAQRRQVTDRARAIVASGVQQLRPILTSDQQQKLDTWSAKMKTREEQHPADAGRFLLMVAMHGGAGAH